MTASGSSVVRCITRPLWGFLLFENIMMSIGEAENAGLCALAPDNHTHQKNRVGHSQLQATPS